MAEVLASLKKIGGSGEQYTENVLWTNPSPTATFAAQNVTLSESMGNYKYIGIRFAYGTSYNTGEYISTLLETVADFRKFGYSTGVRRNGSAICISDANNKAYERMCIYISDTSVRFNTCYQAASSTQANSNAIPLEILGVNELAHQTVGERYDVLPVVTVNARAKPTFTTKGRAKAIFMTYMVANGTVAYTVTNVNPYTGEYDNADTYRTATNSSEITHIGSENPFIVTDNTITTTLAFSSGSQLKCLMSYTY